MGPIARILLRIAGLPEGDDKPSARHRSTYALLEGYVSLIVNAFIAAIKIAVGILTGSVALMADAIHTLSDCVTSAVVIVSAYVARKPADKEHPFGHGRSEYIASLVIGVLLVVAAIEFGKESVERILDPKPVEASWMMLGVVGITVLVKIWNTVFAGAIAKKSGSSSVEADYWHHLTDVLATLLAMLGMAAGKIGIPTLDGYMGFAVCLILIWVAWKIVSEAVNPLLGYGASPEELAEIHHEATSIEEVRNIHDVVVHRYGALRLVSLHIEVGSELDPWEAHEVSERVQRKLAHGTHGSVIAHVDPINDNHPRYAEIKNAIEAHMKIDPRITSFHDLRIVGDAKSFNAVFDVTIDPGEQAGDSPVRSLREKLIKQIDGLVDVVIDIEPAYSNHIPK